MLDQPKSEWTADLVEKLRGFVLSKGHVVFVDDGNGEMETLVKFIGEARKTSDPKNPKTSHLVKVAPKDGSDLLISDHPADLKPHDFTVYELRPVDWRGSVAKVLNRISEKVKAVDPLEEVYSELRRQGLPYQCKENGYWVSVDVPMIVQGANPEAKVAVSAWVEEEVEVSLPGGWGQLTARWRREGKDPVVRFQNFLFESNDKHKASLAEQSARDHCVERIKLAVLDASSAWLVKEKIPANALGLE